MTSKDDAKKLIERWRDAAPALREFELQELREVDVAAVIRSFAGAALEALRIEPASTTSGL
ncbi:MAG: hypothetical protein FJ253_08125, partial [Phycisphaerae bacterium]|nr:hypothetical protein [Phycisphaerae bacterium]